MQTITSLDQVRERHLTWPPHQQRREPHQRQASPFKVSIEKAEKEMGYELGRWGVREGEWVLSRDRNRNGTDPAAAVWFLAPAANISAPRQLTVFACDTYNTAAGNVRALQRTLEYLRAVDRYGAYSREQAIQGARALPPPEGYSAAPRRPWYEVLDVSPSMPLIVAEAVYRARSKILASKGVAGHSEQVDLNLAIEEARSAALRPARSVMEARRATKV